MAKPKEVHFSQARKELSTIIDQVQKSGPVTILRHGKPTAVVISHEEFKGIYKRQKGKWSLSGSLIIAKGVDLDKTLKQLSDKRAEQWHRSAERSAREFLKD